MENLTQTGAILRRAQVAQALAGNGFVQSMGLCRFRSEGWKVGIHIASGEEALKITTAHLAELYDADVHIYNPQLVEEVSAEVLTPNEQAA